jgi:hypothetical protein
MHPLSLPHRRWITLVSPRGSHLFGYPSRNLACITGRQGRMEHFIRAVSLFTFNHRRVWALAARCRVT